MDKKIKILTIIVLLIFLSSCAQQIVRISLPKFIKLKPPIIRVGLYYGDSRTFIFSSPSELKVYEEGEKSFPKAKEVAVENSGNTFKLRIGERVFVTDSNRIYIIPEEKQQLRFQGNNYPGIIVVERHGISVSIVNYVNLEDYVLGVLPYEIPEKLSNPNFLKSQAIAIRSYALYQMLNKNKYKKLGFDICSSYMCQVYKGLKPDIGKEFKKAVFSTKGKVVSFNLKPALTLYSAFCGGETENAKNLFSGINLPYLTSRKVYKFGLNDKIITVSETFSYPSEIDLALNLSIIDIFDKQYLFKDVKPEKINSCFKKLSKLTGKSPIKPVKENSFSSIISAIDRYFGIYEKAKFEISRFEVRNLWRNYPGLREKIVYEYLSQKGVAKRGFSPDEKLSLYEFVRLLTKTLTKFYRVYEKSKFVATEGYKLTLELGGKRKELSFKNSHIYLQYNENEYPLQSIILTGNEEIEVFYIKDKIKILRVKYPKFNYFPDDPKFFPYWVKIYKRSELQSLIEKKYDIGKLEDIVVVKRGDSFRVSEIEIQGTKENLNLWGVSIKYILGLKDTYFIVNREFDETGNIKNFIFIGKGYGHGVGMCQIEAYLLGKRGMKYEQIIKTFYPGTKIESVKTILKKEF